MKSDITNIDFYVKSADKQTARACQDEECIDRFTNPGFIPRMGETVNFGFMRDTETGERLYKWNYRYPNTDDIEYVGTESFQVIDIHHHLHNSRATDDEGGMLSNGVEHEIRILIEPVTNDN